jgi:pimeloyl-ACP methyl ester carboxylesterase
MLKRSFISKVRNSDMEHRAALVPHATKQGGLMSDCSAVTNGIRLHYLDHAGPEPTLVLAPGLTANAHSFDGLVGAGIAQVAHVLALDLRGRGESEQPETGYTMEDHGRDVLGLLDALGLERVVMGGHSFGGLLTYWLAANHPERIEACIVLDAPAQVDPGVVEQIRPSLARLGLVYSSWDEYLAFAKALPFFDDGDWSPEIERYFRADVEVRPDGTLQARSKPEHIQAAVEGTLQVDWPATVARVTQPTLLARAPGGLGPAGSPPLVSRENAEQTVALLSHGELVDGIGNHYTLMFGDGARMLTEHVARFLAQVPSSG